MACGDDYDFFLEEPINVQVNEKGDSVKYANNKEVMLDFNELSYNNIVIEPSFIIENKIGSSFQGLAIYNDYLFQVHNTSNYIDVYDLKNNSFVFSITKKKEGTVHCNNADFGPFFYSPDDPFPLLYLEHKGSEHKTSVYRIVKKDSLYTMTKVQVINFAMCTSAISNNDIENEFIYVTYNHDNIKTIARINFPDINVNNTTIDLESLNVLDRFDVVQGKVLQDATIYKNKLFQLKGGPGSGEICIYDLLNHKIIFTIDWNEVGMSGEPEGIGWYKDHLVISNLDGQVYNIYFVK